jgi:hypothetical protein
MRTLLLLPLAFALTQASAFAAPQSTRSESFSSDIEVRGAAPAYKARPFEIDQVQGTYALDNGNSLKIASEHRKLYVQLGQRKLAVLLPVSENHFASPDQRVTVEFRPQPFNDQIVLTYPSDANVATSELITVRVAANR